MLRSGRCQTVWKNDHVLSHLVLGGLSSIDGSISGLSHNREVLKLKVANPLPNSFVSLFRPVFPKCMAIHLAHKVGVVLLGVVIYFELVR